MLITRLEKNCFKDRLQHRLHIARVYVIMRIALVYVDSNNAHCACLCNNANEETWRGKMYGVAIRP